MSALNATASKSPSALQPIAATNHFSEGPSRFSAPSFSMNDLSSHRERFQGPQVFSRQADGFSNAHTANRQRFQAVPLATPIRPQRVLDSSKLSTGRVIPPLNPTKPSNSALVSGPRHFVPPTPSRQASMQVPHGGQQQRSQSQMPPPPLPGNSRFR